MSEQNANTIQLTTGVAPAIDVSKASCLKPLPGRVIVEMDPEVDKVGVIHLPDNVAGGLRPDVGTVLAVGRPLDARKPIALLPGDRVAVRPYDGVWLEGHAEGYEPNGQLRVYGTACQDQGEPFLVEWWDSILLRLSMEGKKATGKNIHIKRDPLTESEGGIILTDESKYRNGLATVISVGEQVYDVKPGDRVHYTGRALIDFLFVDDPDLAVCTEDAINFVIEAAA